jgi:micrococcal nuclease
MKMTPALCLVVALAALLGSNAAAQRPRYVVERVIDGDTVVLTTLGTVRLIGVDTPETVDPRKPVQHYGVESAEFLRRLTQGRPVRVEYDRQRSDKYRRTLAYVFLDDGSFVNLEIVRRGFGHAYVQYPFQHIEAFRSAERDARQARRGLWADEVTDTAASSATGSVQVWVNTASGVYHCAGTRYYGTTKQGEYMDQAAAQRAGHRPTAGRVCAR